MRAAWETKGGDGGEGTRGKSAECPRRYWGGLGWVMVLVCVGGAAGCGQH